MNGRFSGLVGLAAILLVVLAVSSAQAEIVVNFNSASGSLLTDGGGNAIGGDRNDSTFNNFGGLVKTTFKF